MQRARHLHRGKALEHRSQYSLSSQLVKGMTRGQAKRNFQKLMRYMCVCVYELSGGWVDK